MIGRGRRPVAVVTPHAPVEERVGGVRAGGQEGGLTCVAVVRLWCISLMTGNRCSFISSGVLRPEERAEQLIAMESPTTLYHDSNLLTDTG